MMTFDTKPTSQQLEDKSFWDNLPLEGALFDGYLYAPTFAILKDGQPIIYQSDGDKNMINQFSYSLALEEIQRLSKEYNDISMEINGYFQSYVKYKG